MALANLRMRRAPSEEVKGAAVSAVAAAEAKVMVAEAKVMVAEAGEAVITNNKHRIIRKDRMSITRNLKSIQMAVQHLRGSSLPMKRLNSRSASSERCVIGGTARVCIIQLMASHLQLSLAIFLLLILNKILCLSTRDPFIPVTSEVRFPAQTTNMDLI